MSALRIGRPGEPVRLIDQGPACGRTLHTRGPVAPLGGTLVVAQSDRDRHAMFERRRRQQGRIDATPLPVEPEPRERAICRRWIIVSRAECARQAKHAGSCTTAARLAKLAEQRRAS